jgi:hypothetical protein
MYAPLIGLNDIGALFGKVPKSQNPKKYLWMANKFIAFKMELQKPNRMCVHVSKKELIWKI